MGPTVCFSLCCATGVVAGACLGCVFPHFYSMTIVTHHVTGSSDFYFLDTPGSALAESLAGYDPSSFSASPKFTKFP